MSKSDNINRKFVDVIDVDEWEIETDDGWQDIVTINKTIEYEMWQIETESGKFLKGADNHILFDYDMNEIFIQECISGETYIQTKDGPELVTHVENLGYYEHMYDIEVDHPNHRFYSNDILSHNTQTTAVFLLWYAIFHPHKTIAVLANKAAQAKEILSRITQALENLPFFLQPGCTALNKTSVKFDNGSEIFSAASSSSSIRGRTVNVLYIDECAFIPNDMEFYESTYPVITSGKKSRVIITSTPKGSRGLFYKIWVEAEEGNNKFVTTKVLWDDVPGRDEAWKNETIANTSPAQFDQEFECLWGPSTVDIRDTIHDIEFKISLENLYKLQSDPTYIVYKHTNNTTGKAYVGMTSKCIGTRWKQHIEATRRSNKSKSVLHKAILKYGVDDWTHEILFVSEENDINELRESAIHLIGEHNTLLPNGYNMTTGGEGTYGIVTIKDINGNTMSVSVDDERYLSGELVHVVTGTKKVINEVGDIVTVPIDHPKVLNGEYTKNHKG